MELRATFMGRDDLKEKPFKRFSDAAKIILVAVEEEMNKGGMAWMVLEQCIWIEATLSDGQNYTMKFYCIRDFAHVIGLLKSREEGQKGLIFAEEGDFIEPNDELLRYAFMLSMKDAYWEGFISADSFPDQAEELIGCMKNLSIPIN